MQQLTPPPDNYSHIALCTHLTQVLQSKAHDTVLDTYRQAVAISVAANPIARKHVIYSHKKDGRPVSPAEWAQYFSTLRCTECRGSSGQAMICLQCPHVGCYNHAKTHSSRGHRFAIDSANGLLHCFLCGDYVSHRALHTIRKLLISKKADKSDEAGAAKVNGNTNGSADLAIADGAYTKPPASAVHGLRGIVNLGATCFMSCILQTLLHNPLVCRHFFNNDLHFFNCDLLSRYAAPSPQIDENLACMTCLLDAVFKEVYTSSARDGCGIATLLATAWYKNQLLAGFQEQDAHEFWQFLLGELHLDYERVAESAGLPQEPCRCVVHSTFAGQLESSVVCSACGAITRTVDPLMDLSLEISRLDGKATLYDCLDQFTRHEPLDAKYRCSSCREEAQAHRALRIKALPPVISIQLKRFKHTVGSDTASKIEARVDAPLFLNLSKYASQHDDDIDANKVYELFAVVNHVGLVSTGHYIALVKSSGGRWFKFDDSVISLVSHEEVQATNAYLLFYIAHAV